MAENKKGTEKKKKYNGKGFQPGQSGNPGGRPKLPAEFKELARINSMEALKKTIDLLRNPDVPPAVQLKAAEVIMDRAWGKATQPVSGPDEGPIEMMNIIDLSKLNDKELETIEEIVDKATANIETDQGREGTA